MPLADADEPLPTLEGRALCFGLALSGEEILDPSHADLDPTRARPHLFAQLAGDVGAVLGRGDVIVAEEVSGADAVARPAFDALAAAGIIALVARRFAPTLLDAAWAAGIPTLVVDTPGFLHTGDRIRLDLDAAKIVNLSSGDRVAIRNASGARERATLRTTLERSSAR